MTVIYVMVAEIGVGLSRSGLQNYCKIVSQTGRAFFLFFEA